MEDNQKVQKPSQSALNENVLSFPTR